MAKLSRDGANVVVSLSTAEKFEGLHGDIRFPLASVTSVEVLDDAFGAVKGMWDDAKIAGSYLPGVIAAGTFRNGEGDGILLAFVHRDATRGLQIELAGEKYGRVVVGLADPEGVKAQIFGL
ncbi:hypothetical protein ACFOYW_14155 [Gryllotalpicola reticulitermitis]|uniref:Uncharacterized protein n=1 Tax=Gryllotalpicola reticulitermitis TaxID=1184153 RepID=A0ABV8Q832_9MICO